MIRRDGIKVVLDLSGAPYTPPIPPLKAAKEFVLQDWVADSVGLKMQSILLSGLRAPDAPTHGVKKIVRWMRERCQTNADPAKKSYMEGVAVTDELIEKALDELEYLPAHFVHHFADALAVLAYHHPVGGVRQIAYQVHFLIAEEIFHFAPESQAKFLERHRDRR